MHSDLLAVRNGVAFRDSLDGVEVEIDRPVVVDLKTRIQQDLASTDLADLFKELAAEASE
ncbi:hypothetical protein D3C84_1215330 [compost metagenome]